MNPYNLGRTADKHETKFYAGIGSRETPDDVLDLMRELAFRLMDAGWTLRTGLAPGADQAFARGAGVDAEWSVPWPTFESSFVEDLDLDPPPPMLLPTAIEENIARQYHPAWDRLSQGAQKLHARNVLQVLGKGYGREDFIEHPNPSAFVVCWAQTRGGEEIGGTGQATRIARAYGIPVRNLFYPETRKAAERFVNGEETE